MSEKKNRKRNASQGKKPRKKIVKVPKEERQGARIRKKPQYKSFRMAPSLTRIGDDLPPPLIIAARAIKLMFANTHAMIWFFVVYGILSVVFVSGIVAPLNVEGIRQQLAEATGTVVSLSDNLAILGLILKSSFKASGEIAAIYQMVFVVVSSLALIWLYRQQQAGNDVTLKDAFYRGMYPLVPYVFVSFLFVVQSLPALIGNTVYGAVISGGFAVTFVEQVFWVLLYGLTIVASLYLIAPTLLAMFIVTLPEKEPLQSYQEARTLIEQRRMGVLVRVVALIVFVALGYVGFIFPAIFLSAVLAQVLYFVLTIMALPFIVAYLFVMYRELL